MKDPRKARRTPSAFTAPPSIDRLRATVAGRVAGRHHTAPASTGLVAHVDALGAGRPTTSPAKARAGSHKASPPGAFGLPD